MRQMLAAHQGKRDFVSFPQGRVPDWQWALSSLHLLFCQGRLEYFCVWAHSPIWRIGYSSGGPTRPGLLPPPAPKGKPKCDLPPGDSKLDSLGARAWHWPSAGSKPMLPMLEVPYNTFVIPTPVV